MDIAIVVYLVGFVLAVIMVHSRLAKPECYRIPIAIVISLFWPLVLTMLIFIYVLGLIYDLSNALLNKYEK